MYAALPYSKIGSAVASCECKSFIPLSMFQKKKTINEPGSAENPSRLKAPAVDTKRLLERKLEPERDHRVITIIGHAVRGPWPVTIAHSCCNSREFATTRKAWTMTRVVKLSTENRDR